MERLDFLKKRQSEIKMQLKSIYDVVQDLSKTPFQTWSEEQNQKTLNLHAQYKIISDDIKSILNEIAFLEIVICLEETVKGYQNMEKKQKE